MFTGIIQTVGTIESKKPLRAGVTFGVAAPTVAGRLAAGDSVSVNGVCQTVESADSTRFVFTSVGETLARTTFDALRPGDAVNIETAATPETLLGGHLVQGHVDGVGEVESFRSAGRDRLLTIRLPEDVGRYVVPKGSIAVDGVSLTIVDTKPDGVITIAIVPYTMQHTIFENYRAGTRVNIEADIIGKYVVEYLTRLQGGAREQSGGLT